MPDHNTPHQQAAALIDRLTQDFLLLYTTDDREEQARLEERFYPARERLINLVAQAIAQPGEFF